MNNPHDRRILNANDSYGSCRPVPTPAPEFVPLTPDQEQGRRMVAEAQAGLSAQAAAQTQALRAGAVPFASAHDYATFHGSPDELAARLAVTPLEALQR
jgi:hypothetical protein